MVLMVIILDTIVEIQIMEMAILVQLGIKFGIMIIMVMLWMEVPIMSIEVTVMFMMKMVTIYLI